MPALVCLMIVLCFSLPGALVMGCDSSTSDSTGSAGSSASTADARVIFHAADGREAELMVEVARSRPERAQGLMQRQQLDAESGMIFIWDYPVHGGFWMKDTYIPLSIAFISEDGDIVDIQDMQPLGLANHKPSAKYIYAVEANQGWFAEHGISIGDRAEFLESQ